MTTTFDDKDGFIWNDGELVPWRDATVHILTHSLHYGLAVFEGVRAYKTADGTAIFRLQDHTDRLFESAHILRMNLHFDRETINEAQRTVLRANELESGYIRPIVYYGSEGMGLRADNLSTHIMIAAWDWGRLSGCRWHQEWNTRQDLFIFAIACQRGDVPCESLRTLHEFNTCVAGSARQRG